MASGLLRSLLVENRLWDPAEALPWPELTALQSELPSLAFGATAGLVGLDLIIYSFIIMLIAALEPRGIWGMITRLRTGRRN